MAFFSRKSSKKHGAMTCTGCGTPLEPTAKFCLNCGTPVALQSAAPDSVPDLPPDFIPDDAPAPAAGIVCAACGAALEEGERFCYACGAPVESAQPEPVQSWEQPAPVQSWEPVQPAPQPAPVQQSWEPVQPAPQPAPEPQDDSAPMVICPNCYSILKNGEPVCPNCKTPTGMSPAPAPKPAPRPVQRPAPQRQSAFEQRPAPQQQSTRFTPPAGNASGMFAAPMINNISIEDRLPDGSYKLRFITTPEKGEVMLSSGDWIGRHSTCALVLEDECVSRNHCRFNYENGRWVMALSGTNGLKINGVLYRSDTAGSIIVPNHSQLEFTGRTSNIILEFICNP